MPKQILAKQAGLGRCAMWKRILAKQAGLGCCAVARIIQAKQSSVFSWPSADRRVASAYTIDGHEALTAKLLLPQWRYFSPSPRAAAAPAFPDPRLQGIAPNPY